MKKDEKTIKAEEKFISLIAETVPTHDDNGGKMKLEQRIRYAANAKLKGKYNLVQNKAAKESFNIHKEICSQLVELSEKHNVPCCYVIYFAVGKDAHKTPVFNKGYKKIDVEKAEAIIEMTKAFQSYLGMPTPTDALFHAITKFFESGHTNVASYKSMLASAEPTDIKERNFAAFCKVLGI